MRKSSGRQTIGMRRNAKVPMPSRFKREVEEAPRVYRGRQAAMMANQLVLNDLRYQMGLKLQNNDNMQNLYETFGYKRRLTYLDYLRRYRRQDIAKRIIDATVDNTWKDMPQIEDTKDDSGDTHFEKDVKALFKRFKLMKVLKRADRLACIGSFSVIVIGTKKNKLSEPLPQMQSIDDIAYFGVYSQHQTKITKWVTDVNSPRYGKPAQYTIMTSPTDESNFDADSGYGIGKSIVVNADRVIHVVDETLESEVYGIPKLEPVFNLLDDLLKVAGGSSEMFWLGAYQGLVFNAKEDYDFDENDRKAMDEEIQKYVNKMQRYIKTKGIEVTTLGSDIASPKDHFDMLISLIAGTSNIPKRILLGSELGELASTTDQDNFFSFISGRRNDFAEMAVLDPLIDKLVEHGALTRPVDGDYDVVWPPLFELSQTAQAQVANNISTAAKNMSSTGNAQEVMSVKEFRKMVNLKGDAPEQPEPVDTNLDDLDIAEGYEDLEQGGGTNGDSSEGQSEEQVPTEQK